VIRILVALLILWGLAAARGEVRHTLRQWRDRPAFQTLVAGSIVGPFLGIWLSLAAVQNARLGIASTLMALPPVLLIPLEYALFRRRVSRHSIVGTGLAMAGVALLFW
jgi:drug/metabolite transporter (DMT)-like permease